MKADFDLPPLVTIVTATYRHFEKIQDTVSSVLRQTYPRMEYYICDDASDPFPRQEIEQLLASAGDNIVHAEIIHHAENVGTVRNLNSAYKKGKGNIYINLSCGDSFFSEDVVEKIVKVFQERQAKLVATTRVMFTGDYEPKCMLPHYCDREKIAALDTHRKQYKSLILGMFYDMASGSAMHFSREILEELQYFDETYRLWEDGPFLAKYLWKYKLECAYDIISIWYEDGGVSSSGQPLNPQLYADTIRFDDIAVCDGAKSFTTYRKNASLKEMHFEFTVFFCL